MFLSLSCQNEEEISVDTRDALSITWQCVEKDGEYDRKYEVVGEMDATNSALLRFDNFHELGKGEKISAILSEKTLTIAKQRIKNFDIEGKGTVSSDKKKIEWQYTVDNGNEKQNITAIYTPAGSPIVKK